MGLKLRLNLFRERDAEEIYSAYEQFYLSREQRLLFEGEDQLEFVLRERNRDWTVLELDGFWEWSVRRDAQLYVSKMLNCAGFLIFVYDGDYWGYEFFRNGRILDQFVQEEDPGDGTCWFPNQDCRGDAQLIADEFHLSEADVSAYLIRDPVWAHWHHVPDEGAESEHNHRRAERYQLNVPVRPGDEYRRFDECSVLDFLRFLGIGVRIENGYVMLQSPIWKTFWIEHQNTLNGWLRRYRQ